MVAVSELLIDLVCPKNVSDSRHDGNGGASLVNMR